MSRWNIGRFTESGDIENLRDPSNLLRDQILKYGGSAGGRILGGTVVAGVFRVLLITFETRAPEENGRSETGTIPYVGVPLGNERSA